MQNTTEVPDTLPPTIHHPSDHTKTSHTEDTTPHPSNPSSVAVEASSTAKRNVASPPAGGDVDPLQDPPARLQQDLQFLRPQPRQHQLVPAPARVASYTVPCRQLGCGPAEPKRQRKMATKANPDLRADVDFMILDYLAPALEEEVNWMVEPVRAFRATLATALPDTPLPLDLDIKLRVLSVAHQLWQYVPTTQTTRVDGPLGLSSLGIEFLDLCLAAVSKVSETRWFDTGARFMMQAVMEEQREGNTHPEALSRFYAWSPPGPDRDSKWSNVRERYAGELLNLADVRPACDALYQRYPFAEFKAMVVTFLFELMTTLDPPILVQLERGKLGNLSQAETQRLKERDGPLEKDAVDVSTQPPPDSSARVVSSGQAMVMQPRGKETPTGS
ncbi:uncharacterized protein N7482_009327 [Penicillium canariense]|uniref:Uncharacterized protein n=1 Tax=Penicillium canariense TaxID=189055 RepID=A0A9W9HSY8_9EURO|nr:uncharacterized protein N7482_009327 [Penicillium canariense]KAJ5152849.1 hypothetical protein N7482_009327 [Penicillium canariense]